MPFQIPNEAEAGFPDQAEPDARDFDIMVSGFAGNSVTSGCAVTAQGTPNMTVAVASGQIQVGGVRVNITGGNVTIAAAHATLPRFDLICATSAGSLVNFAGTAAANAAFAPAIPSTHVVLAAVFVPATATAIAAANIVDKRVLVMSPAERLLASWSIDGALAVATGTKRFYIPFNFTVTRVGFALDTSPTGSSARIDLNKNGTTIFTTQTNRPIITNPGHYAEAAAIEVPDGTAADYLSTDVDIVGSTTPGSDAVITVWGRPR